MAGSAPGLSELRRQYRSLVTARDTLERHLTARRTYFRGALSTVAHPNKTGPSTPYHYITCRQKGTRAVVYVPRKDLARARKLTGNWKDFKRDLKRLAALNKDIAAVLKRIVEAQAVEELRP